MNTEKKIYDVKDKIAQLKADYDNRVNEEISKLKNQYRTNSNKTKLVTIQNIEGNNLNCYQIAVDGDDLLFSTVKIRIMDYLNEFSPDTEGLVIIKGILKNIVENLGVDIEEVNKSD